MGKPQLTLSRMVIKDVELQANVKWAKMQHDLCAFVR